MTNFFTAPLMALTMFAFSTPSHAKTSDWAVSDQARAQLLTGVDTIGDQTQIEAALVFELATDWHTYWKQAGDTGLPPRFNWEGSTNVENVKISWPVPERKNEQQLFTVFSYADKQTFPLLVTLKQPNTKTVLDLKMDFMVCKDICIPDQMTLNVALDAGEGETSTEAKLIDFAKRKTPNDGDLPGLKIDSVVASEDALVFVVESKNGFEELDIFPHVPEFAFTSAPMIEVDAANAQRAMVRVNTPKDIENMREFLDGKALSVTMTNGRRMIKKKIQF